MTSTAKLILAMVTASTKTDISLSARDNILAKIDTLINLYIQERLAE